MSKISLEAVAVERLALTDRQSTMLRILSDVHFTLPAAGRLSVIGPSGSGKTSLLRLLNRLDDPAEGRVLLDGVDLCQLDPITVRRRVGMVFQQPFLFNLSVLENMAYPRKLYNQTLGEEEAVALLEEFGLPADYLTRMGPQLSGGQQQRVAVARALTLQPEVLLLDEPSSALDEQSAELLLAALLSRNTTQELTIIMVTHSTEMMRNFAGEALFIHHGQADYFSSIAQALAAAAQQQVVIDAD